MGEGIEDRAVHVDEEQGDQLLCECLIHVLYERVEELIELSHVNREIGYGRNMTIDDFECIDRLEEVLRRLKVQETGALLHELLVIRDDVARAQRCVALAEVADALMVDRLVQELIESLRKVQDLQQGIRLIRHRRHLLLVRQGRGLHGLQHRLACLVYTLHGNISHIITSYSVSCQRRSDFKNR